MRKYDSVVNEINSVRLGENRPWIFTENGELDTDKVILVDTLDWLEKISDYEIDFEYEYPDMELEDFYDNPTYNLIVRDNTYNHLGKCTNDIDYAVFEHNLSNEYFVLVKVHLFGDVRGNYSDTMILHFDSEGEFLDTFYDNYNYTTINVDDKDYYIDVNGFDETITVSDENSDSFEMYDFEIDEIKNEIRNKI